MCVSMIGRPLDGAWVDAASVPVSVVLAGESGLAAVPPPAVCCCAPHPASDPNTMAATAEARATIETISVCMMTFFRSELLVREVRAQADHLNVLLVAEVPLVMKNVQ